MRRYGYHFDMSIVFLLVCVRFLFAHQYTYRLLVQVAIDNREPTNDDPRTEIAGSCRRDQNSKWLR